MPLSHLRRPLSVVLVVYICILAVLHHRGYFKADPPEELRRFNRMAGVQIQGRVVSPRKEDFRGHKVFVWAQALFDRPFKQKLLAYLPRDSDWRSLRPGMMVELEGRLRLPRRARNPGEFDEKAFMDDRGASWILKAESMKILGPPPWYWLPKAWAEGARQSWQGFFERVLPKDEACVLSGLTMGFKGPLRRDWNRSVQDAGAMHILVPSGAKVAFVMLGVVLLATSLGLRPIPRLILAVTVGGFYTLMVGAEAPYTRALWAGAALGLCQILGRDSGSFQAITLAAMLTLLWEPRELFSAGFQMTYAAVIGLVIAMPRLQAAAPGLPRWLRGLAGAAAVSVLVQVMLWPLFANTFGRGSLAGVLANIVLVPASGLMMACGLAAWLAALLVPASAPCSARALGLLARGFVGACRFFAGLPCAAMDLPPMSQHVLLVYYLLVFAILVLPRRRAALALAAAGLCLWTSTALAGRWAAPSVRVLLLRLPPAHPAVVTFADGRVWLVDPGTKVSAVLKALRCQGIKTLDQIILTKPWPARAEARLRRGLAWRQERQVMAPWSFNDGEVRFEFGGPEGPRVLRGEAQYSIIPGRLKVRAVEVASDGRRAEIR